MRTILIIAIMTLMASCVSHKKVTYFNDISSSAEGSFDPTIPPRIIYKPSDLVEIDITSVSKESNQYFYKSGSSVDKRYAGNTYQISAQGTIDLPLIGKIELEGVTPDEAEELIRTLLLDYLQKPTVNIRLVSFQISVLGEVARPGVFDIPDGEVTVLEALAYAGDLTIYGSRDNVLVIRNNQGKKSYFRINLNDSEFLNGQEFYLENNDVLYIEPSKGKTSADDNAYRILPLIISSLTFITVLISISQ